MHTCEHSAKPAPRLRLYGNAQVPTAAQQLAGPSCDSAPCLLAQADQKEQVSTLMPKRPRATATPCQCSSASVAHTPSGAPGRPDPVYSRRDAGGRAGLGAPEHLGSPVQVVAHVRIPERRARRPWLRARAATRRPQAASPLSSCSAPPSATSAAPLAPPARPGAHGTVLLAPLRRRLPGYPYTLEAQGLAHLLRDNQVLRLRRLYGLAACGLA